MLSFILPWNFGSQIIVVWVLGPSGVQKPKPILVRISGFRFLVVKQSPIKKQNFTMSDTQKHGPGRPKGTKNRPGAKAGHSCKDAVKTTGMGSSEVFIMPLWFLLESGGIIFGREPCQNCHSGDQLFRWNWAIPELRPEWSRNGPERNPAECN